MKKKVVVLGAGKSGVGAALLAQEQGFSVFVSDASSISKTTQDLFNKEHIFWEENQHTLNTMRDAHWIIKSPGIPKEAPIIKDIISHSKTVVSEIEFASRYTKANIIAITGSNGKTTTTMLTYAILKEAGLFVAVG